MKSRHFLRMLPAVIGIALTLAACEEAVTPPTRTDAVFTMYGYFNPKADTQAVRVYPVEFLLEEEESDPIDAVVTSVDLTTGESRIWADSIRKFVGGPFGHFFYAPFSAEFEHRYRLSVDRSDGAHIEVTTTVPPLSEPIVTEPDPSDFNLKTPVFWPEAPNLIDIRVRYYSNVIVLSWDYEVTQESLENGQLVTLNFRNDTRDIFTEAIIQGVRDVYLLQVEILAVVTDSEWVPPGGKFDANVLVEPGTFSNVEGGFGFVGSGYQTQIFWLPSDEVLDEAGFTTNE